MSRIFHPLLSLLGYSTRQELARYVNYLKTENDLLRSRLSKKIGSLWEPVTRAKLV